VAEKADDPVIVTKHPQERHVAIVDVDGCHHAS
jgi:hypothetical protein